MIRLLSDNLFFKSTALQRKINQGYVWCLYGK